MALTAFDVARKFKPDQKLVRNSIISVCKKFRTIWQARSGDLWILINILKAISQ